MTRNYAQIPRSVLSDPSNIPSNYLLFFSRKHICKICPDHQFLNLISSCFCVPPWMYIQMHPYNPLHAHPDPFVAILLLFCKTSCSGKFPGHRAQTRACAIIFVSPCIVFVSTHVIHTLMHPSTPIYTHPHLFAPAFTLVCMHTLFNLIKNMI